MLWTSIWLLDVRIWQISRSQNPLTLQTRLRKNCNWVGACPLANFLHEAKERHPLGHWGICNIRCRIIYKTSIWDVFELFENLFYATMNLTNKLWNTIRQGKDIKKMSTFMVEVSPVAKEFHAFLGLNAMSYLVLMGKSASTPHSSKATITSNYVLIS